MVTTHENYLIMWWPKGPKLFSVLSNILEMKKGDGFYIMMLYLNYIEFQLWMEVWTGHLILKVAFSFDWDLRDEYR